PSAGPDRGSKRRREGKEPESASAPIETATRSAGRSTQGSRSRQASTSESALAEEPMQTTSQMEEPSHPEFDAGSGPNWLFDIDALTRTINYEPIVVCTQFNDYADPKSSHDDGSKPSSDDGKKVDKDLRNKSKCKDQEKEDNVNSLIVNDAGTNEDNELSFDPNMSALEDVSTFDFSSDDEDDGAMADMNNLDTIIQVSPTPTIRIYKDHPLDQVIEDLQTSIQTKKMLKNLKEHGFVSTIQQRTNHKDLQNYLFACFLSQEPKKVFKNKKDQRGILIRKKARLVAQGYTQEEMIAYDEIFAPVARIEAIRLFLAFASFKDYVVYQMDIKSAFLYRKIEEAVYVCQPLGFEDPNFLDRVYKVKKAQYELHQAPKPWLTKVKTASTPMKTQKPLLKNKDGEEVDVYMYRSMIDGKKIIITEASIRRDLQLADEEDEAVYKELGDSLVWVATTNSSLGAEQDSGNTLQSDEDRLKINELMALCTTLQNKVLKLEKIKTSQHNEIASLKRKVKKLEKRNRLRRHKLKRLYKVGMTARVESSDDEESLGKELPNRGGLKLLMQVFGVAGQNENVVNITTEELTLAQAFEALKTSKLKVKGLVIQDPGESTTTITISSQQSHDKDKGIMIEEPVKPKKKDQIRLDGKAAKRLKAEFDEEERIAQEQEELSDVKKATLFQQLLEKRRKHIAAKRAEEKRNIPPTQARKRKIMCTYLKNMEGYKLIDLKLKEFDKIQEMFDRAFKKVEDDKEIAELKQLLEIILDKEEVEIEAIPLAFKSPRIVDWKIHKEGKKSYYQIVRADGKSQMYMIFSKMLESFDREDLEYLYKLVKAKFKSTIPVEDLDLLL
nr:hypothetical protein [Tanacetum cinerariifolium]